MAVSAAGRNRAGRPRRRTTPARPRAGSRGCEENTYKILPKLPVGGQHIVGVTRSRYSDAGWAAQASRRQRGATAARIGGGARLALRARDRGRMPAQANDRPEERRWAAASDRAERAGGRRAAPAQPDGGRRGRLRRLHVLQPRRRRPAGAAVAGGGRDPRHAVVPTSALADLPRRDQPQRDAAALADDPAGPRPLALPDPDGLARGGALPLGGGGGHALARDQGAEDAAARPHRG